MNALWQAAPEYVKAQHPPDKKERDCRNYDVANPLSNSLWLGAVGHAQEDSTWVGGTFWESTPYNHLRLVALKANAVSALRKV